MRTNCIASVIAVLVSLSLAVVASAGSPDGSEKLPRPRAPSAPADTIAYLVRVIDTSQFYPPSPDPAGITYLDFSNTLLVSDAEVIETIHWQGSNLFEISLTGSLIYAFTTYFTISPTGFADNSPGGQLFYCDSDRERTYVVGLGPDGVYGTSDDIITSFDTKAFGSTDPEGITFDDWEYVLFIADGVNNKVYRVDPGENRFFDGVPPAGDDEVTHFDTESFGITMPKGITFDPDTGNLYLVGKPRDLLAQVTTSGTLLQMIDISVAKATSPSGLAYAPSSTDPGVMSIYMTDSGIAPNADPIENDGKVYEMGFSTVVSRIYLPLALRLHEP